MKGNYENSIEKRTAEFINRNEKVSLTVPETRKEVKKASKMLLNIPADIAEDFELAARLRKNKTDYVISLIRADLEKNKEKYETLKKL
jgi:hypothetical protein